MNNMPGLKKTISFQQLQEFFFWDIIVKSLTQEIAPFSLIIKMTVYDKDVVYALTVKLGKKAAADETRAAG